MFLNSIKRFHFCPFSLGYKLSSVPLGLKILLWVLAAEGPCLVYKKSYNAGYGTVECGSIFLIESGCSISPDPNTPLDYCHVLKIPFSGNKSFTFYKQIASLNCMKPKVNV